MHFKINLPLTIANTSMLPQELAAVKLKKKLQYNQMKDFCVLLPNETITINVSFLSILVILFDIDLTLMTSNADTII